MRIVGRWLGWVLLIAALAALGRDLWLTWQSGALALASAGELWFALHKNSLQLLEPALVRHVWEPLWDPLAITILRWPAVAVLGLPGLLLVLLSWRWRRRRRRR